MPEPKPKNEPTSSGASTASLLGGAALVGAAAGYAFLAFRFKNFGSTANTSGRFSSGSAEMRAAGAFTKEWVKQVEHEGASASAGGHHQSASGAGSGQQRSSAGSTGDSGQHRQQERTKEKQSFGPPAWALKELGLPPTLMPSLDEAKTAYRARAKALHPDAPGGGNETAFKRLSAAWDAVQQAKSAT